MDSQEPVQTDESYKNFLTFSIKIINNGKTNFLRNFRLGNCAHMGGVEMKDVAD